jgi:hypothetical protein
MADTDFTVADVLAWARTKSGSYEYLDNTNCALCQFLRETGREHRPYVTGYHWGSVKAPLFTVIPRELQGPLCEGTFAGLVARLEKLCPETPVVTKSDWLAIDAYLTEIEQVSA